MTFTLSKYLVKRDHQSKKWTLTNQSTQWKVLKEQTKSMMFHPLKRSFARNCTSLTFSVTLRSTLRKTSFCFRTFTIASGSSYLWFPCQSRSNTSVAQLSRSSSRKEISVRRAALCAATKHRGKCLSAEKLGRETCKHRSWGLRMLIRALSNSRNKELKMGSRSVLGIILACPYSDYLL